MRSGAKTDMTMPQCSITVPIMVTKKLLLISYYYFVIVGNIHSVR
jgi:hypothetical protein